MTTLFISDLHLDVMRPAITAQFLEFLGGQAHTADALYILGDLFEAWVGDDDDAEPGASVASALHALSRSGVPVAFIRGNRDFLVGEGFARAAGLRILPDPSVIDLYGRPTLLLHGDLLCTDDTAYQQFRVQTRDPRWQAQFLARPLTVRKTFAAQAREASHSRQQAMKHDDRAGFETVTDVTPATVADTFARYGTDLMIHGHTHRPAIHALPVGGHECRRIVLGDWYEQGSVLRVQRDGSFALASLPQG